MELKTYQNMSTFCKGHVTYTSKPEREMESLKPMNAFTYTQKLNAETKTYTNWILFFPFRWPNIATMPGFYPAPHSIISFTPVLHVHNHMRCVYFSNHGSHEGIVQRDNRGDYFKYKTTDLWDKAQSDYK